MPSTKDDFRANFAQSYFGVNPALVKESIPPSEWENLDLSVSKGLIPCTGPQFDSGLVLCKGVLKIGDNYKFNHLRFQWSNRIGDDDLKEVDVKHPRLGMVNTFASVSWLQRTPVRQRNRGYATRYTKHKCFNPLALSMSGLGAGATLETTASIWHVYNPVYTDYAEAVQGLLDGDRLGYTLGPMIALVMERGRRYPLVCYRDAVVGFVQNRGILVYPETSEITREHIAKITGEHVKVKS